jgi:quercetin dioxygenase-like cupin family protein
MSKPAYRIEDVATSLRCEPEPEEIVSALAERDYRIFEVEQPPGALVPYHAHEEEETIVVLDGRMQFNVEEELVPVRKGEMIIIRASAVHAAAPIGEKTAKLLIAFGGEKRPAAEAGWEGEEDDPRGA